MTVRAFIILLGVTVVAIAIGDHFAERYTAPGLERSFGVLVIAAAIVAPVAWLLGKIGWISGRYEPGSRKSDDRASSHPSTHQRNGGRP
jgi:hypothetical protein